MIDNPDLYVKTVGKKLMVDTKRSPEGDATPLLPPGSYRIERAGAVVHLSIDVSGRVFEHKPTKRKRRVRVRGSDGESREVTVTQAVIHRVRDRATLVGLAALALRAREEARSRAEAEAVGILAPAA